MKQKDWVGNKRAVFVTNGDSSHSNTLRQEVDYYATPPKAVKMLLELEDFTSDHILEPCAGGGHIANVLKEHFNVTTSDLYYHGYKLDLQRDFMGIGSWHGDVITDPPYKYAQEFVEHALDIVPDGRKVAMFLKLSFLEGQKRRKLFAKYPPKTIWVSSKRLNCGKNGEFVGTGAVCFAWFVWEKGFKGDPIIKWFNPK